MMRFFVIADHDKANGNSVAFEFILELTQLRERFRKKRSTDVAQPDHECGSRNIQRLNYGGHASLHGDHYRGKDRNAYTVWLDAGAFRPEGAETMTYYWHFVFIVWVGIWASIYLVQ